MPSLKTEVEEEIIVPEKTSKKPNGVNIGFVLVEEFETKSEFEEFWTEHEFSKIYNHHMERACSRIGSEDVFRCKYYSKDDQGGELGLIKIKEQVDLKIQFR